jgi:predicted transcriptional regulator
MERHDERELRGVMTHLREVDPSEIEALIRRLLEKLGFSNLKSLLLHVRPHEDLELKGTELISKALEEMKEGEVRTLLA